MVPEIDSIKQKNDLIKKDFLNIKSNLIKLRDRVNTLEANQPKVNGEE